MPQSERNSFWVRLEISEHYETDVIKVESGSRWKWFVNKRNFSELINWINARWREVLHTCSKIKFPGKISSDS